MSRLIRVLLVEDSEDDAELLLRELRRGGFDPTFERVDTREDMMAALDQKRWDIVIADYVMPRFSGLDALSLIKQRGLDLPLIVVSGKVGEDAAVNTMKAGAQDYIVKDNLVRLVPAMKRELRDAANREMQKRMEQTLRRTEERFKQQRAQAEQELRDSEARFRAVFESSAIGVALTDLEGRLTECNPAMEKIHGYSSEELRGKHFAEITYPDDVAPDRELFEQLVAGKREHFHLEKRYVRKDGSMVWGRLTVSLVRNGKGEPQFTIAMVEDINERKQVERALRESEARFKRLAENSQNIIFRYEVGSSSGFSFVSPAVFRILGYTEEEFYAEPEIIFKLVHPDDRPTIEKLLTDHIMPPATNLRLQHKDGHAVWVEERNIPVYDDTGKLVAVEGIALDVTERKRMEEQLIYAQRLEMMGKIASQVAHDLGNLLSPLAGYPELIKTRLPEDDPGAKFCDAMLEAVQQMVAINEDLLALGKRSHVVSEPINLNYLVERAIGHLPKRPSTLAIELDLADDLFSVEGSESQLLRVLSNLFYNAREAMHDAGLLCIKTENVYVDKPPERCSRMEIGEYVKFSVTDTGPGIPAEIIDKIFDPFFTTKRADQRRGSGLGLSIVQAIVDDHQGYVDVESDLGNGSTFSIYLPICREEGGIKPCAEVRGGTERILIVDDDQAQREVVKELLKTLGYSVDVADSGEEGISHLKKQPVDLMVLDMIMPNGIDGAETYRQALGVRPNQRAIIVSGFAESERVRQAQALGAGAFLRKPVTLERIARAVREELDR